MLNPIPLFNVLENSTALLCGIIKTTSSVAEGSHVVQMGAPRSSFRIRTYGLKPLQSSQNLLTDVFSPSGPGKTPIAKVAKLPYGLLHIGQSPLYLGLHLLYLCFDTLTGVLDVGMNGLQCVRSFMAATTGELRLDQNAISWNS
jgi:hypothetical protein